MKRFFCLLCALLLTAACAFAEPVIIMPEMENPPVYTAIPRDFTRTVTPEMFNASGIVKTVKGRHNTYTVTFADEARLDCHREALYYNEYSGEVEQTYETETGEKVTETLPKPTTASAASSLAGWMTFGWPETGEIYPLENESLTHITLDEAKKHAEALLAALGMEGYVCETALDMTLERILTMSEKWGELLDSGKLVSSYRFDCSGATTEDEGYLLRYRRFGTESDLSGQFYADFYVTAKGFATISITDQYAMGEVISIPETLVGWQEAADSLIKELADSRMQPEFREVLSARLAWCPVRDRQSETGMAFTPAWVLLFSAEHDGRIDEMHGIFNAVNGKFITGVWY